MALPVEGLNRPFKNVALEPGDAVDVVRLDPQRFTVVGLVKNPGAFEYPPTVEKYNLMQALAVAGGVNDIADPRFVTVYREAPSGELVSASFPLEGDKPVDAPSIEIKPGDVVAVEQTGRTRTRLLMSDVLRFTVGTVFDPLDLN
jgi:protein involved in polysaccharide export with SLBB domain